MAVLKKITVLIFILTVNNLNANSINDELRVTLQKSKITLDPGGIRDTQSLFISRQVNCELIRNQGSVYVLDAAESINYISPLKVRVKISDKVKFHDGSAVKAEDVLASFDYISKSKNVLNNFFTWIDKIEVIDNKTIEFKLKKETPQLLKVLSSSSYTIFKKEFIEKAKINPKLWEKPLGCGGYKVAEFNKNEIKLTPVSEGLPIRFYIINKNQLEPKELSKYDIINLNVMGSSQDVKDFNLIELFSPKQLFIGLNAKSHLWKNKDERCAFLAKLNINDGILKNYAQDTVLANDLIPKGTFGYSKEANYNERIAQTAKNTKINLHGKTLSLAYLTVSVQEKLKNFYLDMFKGIYPDISMMPIYDVKQFGKKFIDENCDAIVFGLASNYFDGYEFLTIFENNGANFTGITNAKLAQQIKNSQHILDSFARANEYRNIINQIADLCIVKPIVTTTIKKIYIRKNLKAPGIGLAVLQGYFLGNISRDKT